MSVSTPLSDVLPSEALSEEAPTGPWLATGAVPEAVVHPESAAEVAATLSWAAASGVRVVPLASGRRFVGSWPAARFLALSTRRLSGIQVYEPADLTLTAGSGTLLGALDERLRPERQWLPFDPPHADQRTLGGLVATGASGPLWMGYGSLRNHVLGLTLVTGDARTLNLGGRVVKNVAGFDLLKPVVGGAGRLGVITSVCIRTFPVPAVDRVLALRADGLEALAGAAVRVGTAPVMPVSSVLLAPADALGAGAALLVRLHGAEPTVDADRGALERHVGASFDVVSDDDAVVAVRDHATAASVVLGMSTLPSRIPEIAAAVGALPGVAVTIDTYAGSARIAGPDIDAADVTGLRAVVDRNGGALRVRSAPADRGLYALSDAPGPAVASLTDGIVRVFDPGEVMWPPRS